MRVSLMGTISPATERKEQVTSSVFVELGCGESFVFDAGMGCQINYTAINGFVRYPTDVPMKIL